MYLVQWRVVVVDSQKIFQRAFGRVWVAVLGVNSRTHNQPQPCTMHQPQLCTPTINSNHTPSTAQHHHALHINCNQLCTMYHIHIDINITYLHLYINKQYSIKYIQYKCIIKHNNLSFHHECYLNPITLSTTYLVIIHSTHGIWLIYSPLHKTWHTY